MATALRTEHQPSGRTTRSLALIVGALTLAVTAGCADEQGLPATEPDVEPGIGHVHGLGVNPADDALYAATHFGLWVADDGRLERVGDAHHDLMGFTVLGEDRFVASGHPLPEEDVPIHLGLIVSDDGGHTWRSASLMGEADFHALERTDRGLYGYDATGAQLLHSRDGTDWEPRATDVRFPALAVDPDDHTHLLAARADSAAESDTELVRSRDGGRTWEPVDAPAPVQLSWSAPDRLFLVDDHGRVHHSRDGGDEWSQQGSLPTPPGALLDHDELLYADAEDRILVSDDGGSSWAVHATVDPR